MARKIEKVIFKKYYDGERRYVPFGDLPKDLLDTDNIMIEVHEAFYSENNSSNGVTYLKVYRQVDMTPEEIAKEKEHFAKLREKSKAERYENYLKLKKEFENGNV